MQHKIDYLFLFLALLLLSSSYCFLNSPLPLLAAARRVLHFHSLCFLAPLSLSALCAVLPDTRLFHSTPPTFLPNSFTSLQLGQNAPNSAVYISPLQPSLKLFTILHASPQLNLHSFQFASYSLYYNTKSTTFAFIVL